MEGETWENAGDDTIHISRLVNSVLRLGDGGAGADLSIVLAPSYADSYSIRKPIFHHSLVVRQGDILQFYSFTISAPVRFWRAALCSRCARPLMRTQQWA